MDLRILERKYITKRLVFKAISSKFFKSAKDWVTSKDWPKVTMHGDLILLPYETGWPSIAYWILGT